MTLLNAYHNIKFNQIYAQISFKSNILIKVQKNVRT